MKKKILAGILTATMIISVTACGKDENKKEDKKEDKATEQVEENETDETDKVEEKSYITMSPDEIVSKLEDTGFIYSRNTTSTQNENDKTHVLEYDTDDAYAPAWVGYLDDTGEVTRLSIYMGTNLEEDLEMFDELITMFFENEEDKQEFLDFVYKKDAKEGLNESIEIAGLTCYRQNMNSDNSTGGGDYKYSYNVSIYF